MTAVLLWPGGRDGTRASRSMADGDAAQRKEAVVNILRPPPLWTAPQSPIAVHPDDPCVSVALVPKNENKNENLFQNGS